MSGVLRASVVRSFYEAINAKDATMLAAIAEGAFAPGISLVLPPSLPYGGTVEGATKLGKLFTRLVAAPVPVGAHKIRIVDLVDGADVVAAQLEFDWYAPGSTHGIASGALELWRFEDERVAEIRAYYWDTAALVNGQGAEA